MGASGFQQLVSHFGDRTVITYDPRGMERSTRTPGDKLTAETHAEDYHRVIEAAGLGPVDAFGSSGGGMCALHWVVAHPEDLYTLVSHEPPLLSRLEDREMAIKVTADIVATYQRDGFGPAMAKFMQLVMRDSPLTADCLDKPAPDPVQFGLPTEDDGSRDDLLLSGNLAMPPFEPDEEALRGSSVRIVAAIGEEGGGHSRPSGRRGARRAPGCHTRGLPRQPWGLCRQRVVAEQRPRCVRPEVARGVGVNAGGLRLQRRVNCPSGRS
jgi:pimeloyl-ACP methyl ester carboxylesterase